MKDRACMCISLLVLTSFPLYIRLRPITSKAVKQKGRCTMNVLRTMVQVAGMVLLMAGLHVGCETVPLETRIPNMSTEELIRLQQRIRADAEMLRLQMGIQQPARTRNLKPEAQVALSFIQGFQTGAMEGLARQDAAIAQELARRDRVALSEAKPLSEGAGYPWVGENFTHWIDEKTKSTVILEDRSRWDVCPVHEHRITFWLVKDDVELVRSTNPDFPYTMTNEKREESIDVRYLGVAPR